MSLSFRGFHFAIIFLFYIDSACFLTELFLAKMMDDNTGFRKLMPIFSNQLMVTTYIKKYPPIYRAALQELETWSRDMEQEQDFWDDTDDDEEVFKDFAAKYWVPLYYMTMLNYDEYHIGIAVKPKDFPKYDRSMFWCDSLKYEKICKEGEISVIDEVLTLLEVPCEGLEEMFKIAKFYATEPLSQATIAKYKDTVKLRNVLRRNWLTNLATWFKTLKKLDDKDLIVANFEYRLFDMGESANKQIWKYYISFLKDYDLKMMLNVYKCCTRIFIEDEKMIDEYRKEIVKAANLGIHVAEFVTDTILWERQFGNNELLKPFLEKVVSAVTKKPFNLKKCTPKMFSTLLSECGYRIGQLESGRIMVEKSETFFDAFVTPKKLIAKRRCGVSKGCIRPNFDDFTKQDFALPGPLMHYITKNASPTVLQKLYQTCKYFYAKTKIPLCYHLVIGGSKSQYHRQSLQISTKDIHVLRFQELIRNIQIVNFLQFNNTTNNESFSNWIRNMDLSVVKNVFITPRILRVDDLQYLLANCTKLKRLDCVDVDFFNAAGETMDKRYVKNCVKKHFPKLLFKN